MNYTRMLFDRLSAAGRPAAAGRERIYEDCRREVAALDLDEAARSKALESLEKVIRRQEMQALYEDTLNAP